MKILQELAVNRDNAILVVVDVENEFCKPGGALFNEVSARVALGVIATIGKMLDQAHSAGIPVIYIDSMRTHREAENTVFKVKPHLTQGTWASEIVDEIKPQAGDIIVSKFCHDPFFKPDLDKVLKKLVPEPTRCYAIVTGGNINICVYHAVMGFHLRDYWTVVPLDAVYYMSEVGNARALEQFCEPAYFNVFLSRSDLIKVSNDRELLNRRPFPGS